MVRSASHPQAKRATDLVTIALLLLGGFALLIGWVVGVVLLWRSRTWTRAEKLIGTLLVPGGLSLPVAFTGLAPDGYACSGHASSSAPLAVTCQGGFAPGAGAALIAFLVVAQCVSTAMLFLVARRGDGDSLASPGAAI